MRIRDIIEATTKEAGIGDFAAGIAQNFDGGRITTYSNKDAKTDKEYDDLLNTVNKSSSVKDEEKKMFQNAMTSMYQNGPNPKAQATFYLIAQRAGIEWSEIGSDVKKHFRLDQRQMPGAEDMTKLARNLKPEQLQLLINKIQLKLKNQGATK